MHFDGLVRMTLVVGLACFAVTGCAADDVSEAPVDDGSGVDELNSASLREATAMKGTVAAGSSLTLHYDKTDAKYPRAIPYLAVEIVSAPARASAASAGSVHPMNGETGNAVQTVAVQGRFPGTPRAIVVDENFKVLSRGTGTTQADGSELVDFSAPRQSGKRFVLIRDGRWSKPMDFQVRVGQ